LLEPLQYLCRTPELPGQSWFNSVGYAKVLMIKMVRITDPKL